MECLSVMSQVESILFLLGCGAAIGLIIVFFLMYFGVGEE